MLRSTSQFTSFSKLENNPPATLTELPAIVTPPKNFGDVRIGASNESPSLKKQDVSNGQGFTPRDLSDLFVRPLPAKRTPEKLYVLRPRQRWEGTVTEVGNEEFTAVLTDLSDPQNADEEAVFSLSELDLPEEELRLVAPGSSFYWILGTEKSPAGINKNVSIFQFKRSPKWSRNALKRARAKADRFGRLFATNE